MTAIESRPVLVGDVLRVRPDPADAGVVDDDVEPPEVGDAGRERPLDLVALRHVRLVGLRADAGLGQLPGGDLAGLAVDLGHGDVGAGLGQRLGDPPAQAGARTRHQCDLAIEYSAHRTPPITLLGLMVFEVISSTSSISSSRFSRNRSDGAEMPMAMRPSVIGAATHDTPSANSSSSTA